MFTIVDNFWQILTIDDNFHNLDNCFCHFDNWKYNPGDLWNLRHWLQFWQLRTWIHDNLCYLTINCDTGQHSQFLRCFKKKVTRNSHFSRPAETDPLKDLSYVFVLLSFSISPILDKVLCSQNFGFRPELVNWPEHACLVS